MFARPEVMEIAAARAAHAALRQSAIAGNVANADTSGYRARDLAGCEGIWRDTSGGELRHTRRGHLGGADAPVLGQVTTRSQPGSVESRHAAQGCLKEAPQQIRSRINAVAPSQVFDRLRARHRRWLPHALQVDPRC